MNEQPLVTVNILSFNRKDELRNTLTKVYEQDYKNIEVIVVDNASNDGSAEMVRNEFPSVQLIQMDKNIGIAGWNEGFKVAKGEYVLVLDDDSYPDVKAIPGAVLEMTKNEKTGIIALNIFNLRFHKSETERLNSNQPLYFIGCGALIRKSVLEITGLYDELFFIYYNEVDLSIRFWEEKFNIKYLPDEIVFHNVTDKRGGSSKKNYVQSQFNFYFVTIGYEIFLIKYFDLHYVFFYSIKWFANRIIIAFRFNYLFSFIKAYYSLLNLLPKIISKRKRASKPVQKMYNNGKIPLIDRDYFPNFIKPSINRIKFKNEI